MAVRFKMCGRLSMPRETEKFHPYQDQVYEKSGWHRKVLNFNVQSDTNSHILQIAGGCFNDGHGMIYTAKATDNGKTENIQIPFKDRLKQSNVDMVVSSRKFIIDLEKPGRRRLLADASRKIENGSTLADEELKAIGLSDQSEVEDALKESNNLRKEFISEWDYIDAVKAILDHPAYNGKKFTVSGNGDYTYNGRFYENLVPNRIYLAADDEEEYATETVILFTTDDSVDEMSVEDLGKYYINGWHREYVNSQTLKGSVFVPIRITIHDSQDEKAKKKIHKTVELFKHDDSETLYQCSVTLNMINGSPRVKLDESMISDEDKELLEMELVSWGDLVQKYGGGSMYGERVTELAFEKFNILNKQVTPAATAFSIDDTEIKKPDEDDNVFDEDGDDDL